MIFFRKTTLYILCWCLCVNLAAQTSKLDSLERHLVSGGLENSEKALLLKNIANEYLDFDTAKARIYAFEALKLSQNIGLKKIEVAAYIALSNSYYPFDDTAKYTMYLHEALRVTRNNSGLELEEGVAHINLGLCYVHAGKYYLAHTHFKEAEKLLLKIDDKERLSILYIHLIVLFDAINDLDNIVYYANILSEISAERDDQQNYLFAQFMLLYIRYKDNFEAVLENLLDLQQKSILQNSFFSPFIAVNCGKIYIQLNRPREALQSLLWVRDHCEVGDSRYLYKTFAFLAETYAMLHQADSAEYYLKKVWEVPGLKNEEKLTQYRVRSLLDSYKGDYRSALESFKKYHHLSDSIAKTEKTAEMSRMKNWHELEQKDNENEILHHEQQKQQKLIRFLTGALMMILVLLTLSVILIRKTNEKNREMKQLHSVKDKLFSVVAHDLRSPMGALISTLKLADSDILDAKTQAQLLKDISVQVEDTYGLLDNLLHWSKSQMQGMASAPVYFDVQEGSRAVTDSLQAIAAHKNIVLNNIIEKQLIYADRDMFAVVVRNLTMNAIKYTPEAGEITLSSELKDDMVVISVKDNGTGMTKEVQDKLFKLSETRSQRGTNKESGTGLGLVLCADFVKNNGGNIWFTSVQGEGSTFFFSIPVK